MITSLQDREKETIQLKFVMKTSESSCRMARKYLLMEENCYLGLGRRKSRGVEKIRAEDMVRIWKPKKKKVG
jgi:hypothetical protein